MFVARILKSSSDLGFNIFRTGRKQYDGLFHRCRKNGWNNIALFGDTELTELALLVVARFPDMIIHGIVDTEAVCKEHYGVRVATSPRQLLDADEKSPIQAVVACHYLASIDEFMDARYW